MKRVAILVLTLLAGCDLYWDQNSGDDVCTKTPTAGAAIPACQDRDPTSGTCSSCTSTESCTCTDSCGEPIDGCECPVEPAPVREESSCLGACEALAEDACLATAGCHAAYEEALGCPATPDIVDYNGEAVFFSGCWDIEPLAPLEGGDCTALDAYTCAQHDDCVSIMGGTCSGSGTGAFGECAPESGSATACEALATEAACDARPDCTPVYAGSDCECTDDGCTCASETYTTCEPADQSSGSAVPD